MNYLNNHIMDAQHKKISGASNIKVFCRFRPFNDQQLQFKAEKVHRLGSQTQLIIKDPNKSQEVSFMFDRIFDMQTHQQQVFDEVGRPILNNILDGFNGTIMAYGQTSSGKTHTMQGYDMNNRDQKGLIPRIIENLFTAIQKSPDHLEFKLKTSIFQIYMERVRDLLDANKADLKIRENKTGPYIEDLTEAYISDKNQLYRLLKMGQKNRVTCSTIMNAHSSRSHLIFLLTLNQFNNINSQSKTSKMFLIDLAGSEKVSKTGAQGQILEQAKKINMSLASLGKVIKSLSKRIHHIPYRDSKLTRILKDSLGGNSKTTLIVTCSPHQIHISQTISTLRFGENAQKIKNKPKINRQLTVQELQKMVEQLESKINEKDAWIKTLEEYISKQLKSNLPKITLKIPNQKIDNEKNLSLTVDLSSTLQVHSKISDFTEGEMNLNESDCDEESFTIQQEKTKKMKHLTHSAQIISHIPIPEMLFESGESQQVSQYDDQLTSLQSEIANYKENWQLQVHKYNQLKKQYNQLNENLKQVIEKNIVYQYKDEANEKALQTLKRQLVNRFRDNTKLVVGQFLAQQSADGSIDESFRKKIDALVSLEDDNIKIDSQGAIISSDCLDYWRNQKKQIQIKLQEVTEKSIKLQKKLDIEENNASMSPPSSQQNREELFESKKERLLNEKIVSLKEQLKSIQNQYQKIRSEQTSWKVECNLYELKLMNKEQKIGELKGLLKEIQEQMEYMNQEYEEHMNVNTKIVKPIKGGFFT